MPKQATTTEAVITPAGHNRNLENRIFPRSLKGRLDLQPGGDMRHCVVVIYIPGRRPPPGTEMPIRTGGGNPSVFRTPHISQPRKFRQDIQDKK
jgi:hypothetical protein